MTPSKHFKKPIREVLQKMITGEIEYASSDPAIAVTSIPSPSIQAPHTATSRPSTKVLTESGQLNVIAASAVSLSCRRARRSSVHTTPG